MTDPTAAERIVNVVHGKLLFHTPDGYDTICTCIGEPYVTQIVNAITTALAEARQAGKREGLEEAAELMKARKGCNCACVDIGVGDLHEPTCGLISPEEAETEFRRRAIAEDDGGN